MRAVDWVEKKKRGSWKITVRLLEGLNASSRRLTQLLSLPLTSSPPHLRHFLTLRLFQTAARGFQS